MMMTLMMILTAVQSSPAYLWGHAGGWHWLWILFALLFWIGLGAAVAYLLTHVTGRRQQSGANRARDILAERFARGEITPEEYDERLSYLS
jgi:putative membrane protein